MEIALDGLIFVSWRANNLEAIVHIQYIIVTINKCQEMSCLSLGLSITEEFI